MKKKIYAAFMITGVLLLTTACGQQDTAKNSIAETSTEMVKETKAQETKTEAETKAEVTQDGITLKDMSEMLNLSDEDAKDLLGGGTENWTEDKTILIGRDYSSSLFDQPAEIHTMYDDNKIITVVQAVLEGSDVAEYQKKISDATGVTMEEPGKGELDQTQGQWTYEGKMISLFHYENTVTIEIFTPI